jgi:hypothetical protein
LTLWLVVSIMGVAREEMTSLLTGEKESEEMGELKTEKVVGYYLGENLIQPLFQQLSLEEFQKEFPGRMPVLGSHLADDEDYVPDGDEEEEAALA